MKKIVLPLLIFLLIQKGSMAQNPNGYCSITLQDSIDISSNRYSGQMSGVRMINAPDIDGYLDAVWTCAGTNISLSPGSIFPSPDSSAEAEIWIMYDSAWLYIFASIKNDDELILNGTSTRDIDHLEISFQNTWGGKGDGSTHCNEDNWWWYFWENDGDRRLFIPSNKDYKLQYDDQDINDACVVPHPAIFGDEAAGWLTLGALEQVLLGVDTAKQLDGTFRINYELALNWKNWLGFEMGPPTVGHQFGLEVAVVDWDKEGTSCRYYATETEDFEWCSPLAISKFQVEDINYPCGSYNYSFNRDFLVLDAETAEPIQGAEINCASSNVITDENGEARIVQYLYIPPDCIDGPSLCCCYFVDYSVSHNDYKNEIGSVDGFSNSNVTVYLDVKTGVDNYTENNISYYPNPAQNKITIQSENACNKMIVSLLQVDGKLILSETFRGSIHELDVSVLSPGIYFIRFETDEIWHTEKLVIGK